MKLSRVTRCRTLPPNTLGRDLIVGDLHGHRILLEEELARLGFDASRDRVLSVGDLVNRGPNSLATLSLIEEPWFHAVLGNHELMLLNFLGYYGSRIHGQKSFPSGGAWIRDALHRHRRRLARLAERVAALPLALHVQGPVPFNVAHSDLRPIGSCQEGLFRDATICVHKADMLTSSRQHVHEAQRRALWRLSFAQHSVRVSDRPLGHLPITYVGHSPLQHVTVHDSYVYVDQRVCAESKRTQRKPPTMLDHANFAFWLRGVATARVGPAALWPVAAPAFAAA
jgi:serine/threonine protein phosphatase 1